jgi:hypothetical protein
MNTTKTAAEIATATTAELRRMYMAEIAGEQNADVLAADWPSNGMTDDDLREYLLGARS